MEPENNLMKASKLFLEKVYICLGRFVSDCCRFRSIIVIVIGNNFVGQQPFFQFDRNSYLILRNVLLQFAEGSGRFEEKCSVINE